MTLAEREPVSPQVTVSSASRGLSASTTVSLALRGTCARNNIRLDIKKEVGKHLAVARRCAYHVCSPGSTDTLGVLRQQQKPAYGYSAALQQLIANRTCFPPCHFLFILSYLTRERSRGRGPVSPYGIEHSVTLPRLTSRPGGGSRRSEKP